MRGTPFEDLLVLEGSTPDWEPEMREMTVVVTVVMVGAWELDAVLREEEEEGATYGLARMLKSAV